MSRQREHPTDAEPQPPFPEQEQEPPGREAGMQPLADHGEDSYEGHGRLTDRVALVTGADSGIGRAVALAFAREGADVLCSYWKEDEDAAQTRALVEDAGRRCLTAPGDIGDRDHCRALVERVVGELGRLDVLVNNAAYQMAYESFLEIPPVELELPAEKNAQFGADTPLGRPGQPGELAPLFVFLAGDESRYISGEVIGATGGKPLH